MRLRSDLVFISSLLFTTTLLCAAPASFLLLSSGTYEATITKLDTRSWGGVQMGNYLGVASLAILLIGLIVVWTGYAKRSRSAWLAMFAVTWAWVFPLFALPALNGPRPFSLPEWVYDVISEQGSAGAGVQWTVIFSLMLVALFLPFKSFFLVRHTSAKIDGRLHKLISGSAVTLLLVALALLVGIHIQVFEIPSEQLNAWRVPPVPAISSELTVEQVLAAPQAYSHRLITIHGCYLSGFEVRELLSCKGEPREGIWIADATVIREHEQLHLKFNFPEPLEVRIHPSSVFVFPYDEAKDRLTWKKLSREQHAES